MFGKEALLLTLAAASQSVVAVGPHTHHTTRLSMPALRYFLSRKRGPKPPS